MRVFLSCHQSRCRHPIFPYTFWETYFKKGIEESGHEWVESSEVDWAEALLDGNVERLEKWRVKTWGKLLEEIKKIHSTKKIDIFLSYLFPKQVDPSAIKSIQSLGIPCVNFFCDHITREYKEVPQPFHCFDLNWVPEIRALRLYQKAGLKYLHAPMPCWIPQNQRDWNHLENYGVTFIGSAYGQRAYLLSQALRLGAKIEIRGGGWIDTKKNLYQASKQKDAPRFVLNQLKFLSKYGISALGMKIKLGIKPKIPREYIKEAPNKEKYVQIIQQSTITLGINRYVSYRHPFSKPDTYSKLRDVEAPMMGACYLTEWTEGLHKMYTIGEEIETYHDAKEMVQKINELLKNPEKRKSMRLKGQMRALKDHSIVNTMSKICEKLDIK